MNSNQTNKRYQRSQVNRRASESCLEEIERAFRLDPEQIMLRKFPHHKIGFFQNFYVCVCFLKSLKDFKFSNKKSSRLARSQRIQRHCPLVRRASQVR